MAIEGNTSTGNDSNGGEVMRRIRSNNVIVGAFGPAYEQEETEEDMVDIEKLTDDQLVRLAERMQAALAKVPISATLQGEVDEAKVLGITDGSGPNRFCTRVQCAAMVKRAVNR